MGGRVAEEAVESGDGGGSGGGMLGGQGTGCMAERNQIRKRSKARESGVGVGEGWVSGKGVSGRSKGLGKRVVWEGSMGNGQG